MKRTGVLPAPPPPRLPLKNGSVAILRQNKPMKERKVHKWVGGTHRTARADSGNSEGSRQGTTCHRHTTHHTTHKPHTTRTPHTRHVHAIHVPHKRMRDEQTQEARKTNVDQSRREEGRREMGGKPGRGRSLLRASLAFSRCLYVCLSPSL